MCFVTSLSTTNKELIKPWKRLQINNMQHILPSVASNVSLMTFCLRGKFPLENCLMDSNGFFKSVNTWKICKYNRQIHDVLKFCHWIQNVGTGLADGTAMKSLSFKQLLNHKNALAIHYNFSLLYFHILAESLSLSHSISKSNILNSITQSFIHKIKSWSLIVLYFKNAVLMSRESLHIKYK